MVVRFFLVPAFDRVSIGGQCSVILAISTKHLVFNMLPVGLGEPVWQGNCHNSHALQGFSVTKYCILNFLSDARTLVLLPVWFTAVACALDR